MSALIAILLRILPLLTSIWPLIMAFINHTTASTNGVVGMNTPYMTHVVGQGVGGITIFGVTQWLSTKGIAYLKCGEIAHRLRVAAKLDESSSSNEVAKAVKTLEHNS